MRIKRRNGLVSAMLGLVTCGLYHIFSGISMGKIPTGFAEMTGK